MAGLQVWVTSAMEDAAVNMALLLASSLRRVKSSNRMVVLTTIHVSKDLRLKLDKAFHHVVMFDPEVKYQHRDLETLAKIHALSLKLFDKCVYLSPSMMAGENCDDIFDKYGQSAVSFSKDGEVDTSIFLYIPSNNYFEEVHDLVEHQTCEIGFGKKLVEYFEKCSSQVDKLDWKYNVKPGVKHDLMISAGDISIFNFGTGHPLGIKEMEPNSSSEEKLENFIALPIVNDIIAENSSNSKMLAETPTSHKIEPIAIVGMSFRLPGANNVDEFWDLLVSGRDAVQQVPPHRWTKEHTGVSTKNYKTEAGFLSIPVDEFDAKFFGISHKDAVYLDPQQRLLHEVSWEALEDAGMDPLKLHGTHTGIFIGSWIHDYRDILMKIKDYDFFRSYIGNSIASEAARLSHFYGCTGPSIGSESGCSSSISAIDLACKHLRRGGSSLAIVGGVNLLLQQFTYDILPMVLARDGRCKTFDAKADGFARAEGCGVFIMKRLSDAVRDGNKIWGLIRGSAVTQEGISKSLGTPTVQCEALAMELAMKDAGVEATDVQYIEAHGTGTAVGDPMEIAAITKAYSKGRTEPLMIGSVKTNVGHTESASGITGMIKVLLSMKHEMIPPHRNLETLNPKINLDAIPATIPLSSVPWIRHKLKKRIAGVSSFGICGTDGHVILEEPPLFKNPTVLNIRTEPPVHIMKISAKTHESLELLIEKYTKIFSFKKETLDTFADFAYSANIGRSTFNHRAVLIGKDFDHVTKILEKKFFEQNEVQGSTAPICFLFTGQGSQYSGMAKQLYTTSPTFKFYFDKCSRVLRDTYNIPIEDILWDESNADKLNRTLYSQTSIFSVEYSLLKLWESWGVKPDYVMGHSLGEIAAAVAAEVLDVEDALMLVAERSLLIDNLPRGKMLVLKADKGRVEDIINKYRQTHSKFWADYAAINSAEQTVLAGDSEMIEDFNKFCGESNLKTVVLASTHAFHSRHMDPMLEEYRKVASSITFKKNMGESAPKYISGMEGKLIEGNSIDADYWVRHTREKVSFMDACKVAQGEGCNLFIEVGPHPILSALTMMNNDSSAITCIPSMRRKEDDWSTILDSLGKLYLSEWKGEIDWKAIDKGYQRRKVNLPFYPFIRKSIWPKLPSEQPLLHPLLGKVLPTPANQTIYDSDISLKQTASFAQDHVIGNTIVFPGAGFLEMCLAGGYASIQGSTGEMMKPRRPFSLLGLKISCPLAMHADEFYSLQTIVSLDENEKDGYFVNIHRHTDTYELGKGNWVLHATCKFLPVAESLTEYPKIDIENIKSTWVQSSCNDFYDKLPSVGLRFGPSFQSLECSWISEEGTLFQVKVPKDQDSYLIHPVIGDAMIQANMIGESNNNKAKLKLQVPVHIGEFIYNSYSELPNRYIYSWNVDNSKYCILLDGSGAVLAYMGCVDLVETTVKLVEGMIHQQSVGMPKLWEEIWKDCPGPLQNSLNLLLYELPTPSEASIRKLAEANDVSVEEKKFYQNCGHMIRMYFLKAFQKLGWAPKLEDVFTLEDFITSLGISINHKKYISFFLNSLVEAGHLQLVSDSLFKADISSKCSNLFELKPDTKPTRDDQLIIQEIGENLSGMLTGEINPLEILFSENPSKLNVNHFYSIRRLLNKEPVTPCLKDTIGSHFVQAQQSQKLRNGDTIPIRVLEVGSGTGSGTEEIIEILVDCGIHFELYYTDISAAFFGAATQAKFEKYLKCITFKKYDMEVDPLEQGFCPNYFDFIFAFEVLHVSKQLEKTVSYLHSLLKPGGVLTFTETIVPDPIVTFIFGLLEGYWGFEDFHLRPDHITLSQTKWESLLYSAGFNCVQGFSSYMGIHGTFVAQAGEKCYTEMLYSRQPGCHTWLLYGDIGHPLVTQQLCSELAKVNRKAVVVENSQNDSDFSEESIKKQVMKNFGSFCENRDKLEGIVYMWALSADSAGNRNQHQMSLPFLTILQKIGELNQKRPPKVFLVTQGVTSVDDSKVSNPSAGTLLGMVKSILNENIQMNIAHLDMSPASPVEEQVNEIFINLWMDGVELRHLSFRNGNRFRPALILSKRMTCSKDLLQIPSGCDRFKLTLPKTNAISDLEFTYLDRYQLVENEVEVTVKAVALNFRDVFSVLKPTKYFDACNQVGLDLSGVVTKIGSKVTRWKVGDQVIGLNPDENLALPSHIKADETSLISLPHGMTHAEGVTLPAVFFTVYRSLIQVAEMKQGETILIHTASGGVGLCAIQFCQRLGVNIITTAGSLRKRDYLRNLGIQHVFNSRTTDFGHEIMKATKGRGVDIVLNSITGPGFKEASLDTLSKNGRFIEMSKLSVWTVNEVKELRPDVLYSIVDITSLSGNEFNELRVVFREYLEAELIRPITYELFDALNVREALNYLRKAKHIGKVVCIMPNVTIEDSKFISKTPLFNECSTYLVTGGLGGIGFEVVKWILDNGGKYVAIASRSAPNANMGKRIELINKGGKHVKAFSLDIGNFDNCKNLIDALPELGFPKLRGIMHAAGVLADSTVENQSWNSLLYTYNPKVSGTWNLHDLTKDMLLEHFVLFSSMAAMIGSPGQINHSASTKFEDCFAAYRRSLGLCGASINWGNWGEVGVATEIEFPGVRPISTSQGLLALETVMKTQALQVGVFNVESFPLLSKVFHSVNYYVDDKRLFGDAQIPQNTFNADEFWKGIEKAEDRHEKVVGFKDIIKAVVCSILKMDSSEKIDDHVDFNSIGIDSLMMLELKNELQNVFGNRVTLTASELRDCHNTQMLADRMVSILEGEDSNEQKLPLPSPDELKKLIREDSHLPQEICPDENLLDTLKTVTEIESVLLTGVTGNFGPYVLEKLVERNQIKKVYCLIRKSRKSAEERLAMTLIEKGLQVDMSKVNCIEGDVSHERFGLEQNIYEQLSQEVDCIVHSAAYADHTAKYHKCTEATKVNVRTVNVGGTLRVLKFAVAQKLKHVLHISTVLAMVESGEDGTLSENWQDVGAFDNFDLNMGYPLSKHIAEQLVRQGVERGIPCKAVRLPLISGDSVTGCCSYIKNHTVLRALGFMKLGCMPENSYPMPVLPVDKCAKFSLDLFFNPTAPSDVYNFGHPTLEVEQALIGVAEIEFGIQIKAISLKDFNAVLELQDNFLLDPFKKLYAEYESLLNGDKVQGPSALQKYIEDGSNFVKNSKILKYIPEFNNQLETTSTVMSRDLQFLKRSGVFEKFGIQTKS